MLMPLGNGSVNVEKCASLSSSIIVIVVVYLSDISEKKKSESSLLQLSIIDWVSDYISVRLSRNSF